MFKQMDPIEIEPNDMDSAITCYTETLGLKIQRRGLQSDGLIAVSPGQA